MPSLRIEGELQETCLGLPLVGERVLNDYERVALQDEAARATWHGWAWGCAIPLFFFGGFAIAAAGFALLRNQRLLEVFLMGMVAFITLLPAYCYKRAKYLERVSQSARRDLKESHIKIFGGEPMASIAQSKIGGVPVGASDTVTLEVFTTTRRLWRVNEKQTTDFIELLEERTAPQPPQAGLVAKLAKTPIAQDSANIDITFDVITPLRRDLSELEREELQRHARKLWRRPALRAGGFFLFWVVIIKVTLSLGATIQLQPEAWHWIIVTLIAFGSLYCCVLDSLRLGRDAREGSVTVMRQRNEANTALDVVTEVLPHSGWTWTTNGQPASWRCGITVPPESEA